MRKLIVLALTLVFGVAVAGCSDDPQPAKKARYKPPPLTLEHKAQLACPLFHVICLKHGIKDKAVRTKLGAWIHEHAFDRITKPDFAGQVATLAQSLGLPVEQVSAVIFDCELLSTLTQRVNYPEEFR